METITRYIPLIALALILWHSRAEIHKHIDRVANMKEDFVVETQMSRILDALKMSAITDDSFTSQDFPHFIRTHMRNPAGGDPALDPWGTPYRFKMLGTRATLESAGPDRTWGTQDDVRESIELTSY